MARGKDQAVAILALPAANRQKSEARVTQPNRKSFWVQSKGHERPSTSSGSLETKGPQDQQNALFRRSSLHSSEPEDSIVASAECLLSLANSQTSSQLRWGVSDSRDKEVLHYSVDASNEVTNLPLSQESVTMRAGAEPADFGAQLNGKRRAGSQLQPAKAVKQKRSDGPSRSDRRSFQSDPLDLPNNRKVVQSGLLGQHPLIGKRQETNSGLGLLDSWYHQKEELALATQLLEEAARSVSEGPQHSGFFREQHVSKKARVGRQANSSQLLMHPFARGPRSVVGEGRKETSAGEGWREISASEPAVAPKLPRSEALNMYVPTQLGKSSLLLRKEQAVEHVNLVDTQESQAGVKSDFKGLEQRVKSSFKAVEQRKWKPDWQSQLIDLAEDEGPQETSASQQTESCGKALEPLSKESGEGVKMERLYDFFGRPFRIYVPARLWIGVADSPEVQAQREKESRLVLSELGTMIGLKNARQYSPEFTLSKMSDDKIINLTSFELADNFLAKVTKNEATREQLRAHLKDVTLPNLRKGSLCAKPKGEESAKPTSVLALAQKAIELRSAIRSQLGDVQSPIDIDKEIGAQMRPLEQEKLTIVVVGKPGSAKSLTCNRLVVPGSDGMDGPFHPVPESRDHGTVVPVFVEKTSSPGLITQVIGRQKEQYVKLVERRYRGGAITDEQLKNDYKCEPVVQGLRDWQLVCSLPGYRIVVPRLEAAIPGVESVGSDPKVRARFYTSRIRQHYTAAQQLMIEKVVLQSNQWEGLEENWALGDTVGYMEQESQPSGSLRGVTDDIVRESVREATVVVHCCVNRARLEEDGALLLKMGVFEGTPETFPVIVCPERPSTEVTAEKIWQDNLAALSSGIKHPERLASRHVPALEQLLQKQEAIIRHLHSSLLVLQPVKALNCPELKDQIGTAFARCRTGPVLRSLSIWLDAANGLLKQQAQLGSSARSDTSFEKQTLDDILQADKRDFQRHFSRTLAEMKEHAEEALVEAASKLAHNVLGQLCTEAGASKEARVHAFRAKFADTAHFGSDFASCINQLFYSLVEQGCKDRVERQSALLERVHWSITGRTEENEGAEGPLHHYSRAARAYIESQSESIVNRPMALESAVQWRSDGSDCSTSYARSIEMPQAKGLLQAISQTCWDAMLGALEMEGPADIVDAFKTRVLKAFLQENGLEKPLLPRLFSWAGNEYFQLLNTASEKSLQPRLHQQETLSANRPKLTSLVGEATRLADEVQRHSLHLARSPTESEAFKELPKPLIAARPSKSQEFELLPEVGLGGVEVKQGLGRDVTLSDLRPEPRDADPEASTSGRKWKPSSVVGKLMVANRLLEKIRQYKAALEGHVDEAKPAMPVLFFLSHLEDQQSESSVRFDFPSDSQQCTVSFVVCKQNQAELHRRLLDRVPDTFLVTIPDDSSTAAYFAAAQIVYTRLFQFELERGHGSYLLLQNIVDGVSELSGKTLASRSSTIQRAAAFVQQVLVQERERAQRAVLTELSSRDALLQLSDLLLDDLLDRDIEPGEQMTREEQREITRDFEAAFSPDRKLREFPRSDLERLIVKCKGARTRRWLLTCAQKLHPTAAVSICKARDQLMSYARDSFPDNLFQSNQSVQSLFLLVDARATQALSPLHVAGINDEGRFNQRLLSFARFCFKRLESQGRKCLVAPLFGWRSKAFVTKEEPEGSEYKQPIDDLHVSNIEQAWKHPPTPQTLPKPEGFVALSRKLPGPRYLRFPQTVVDGNGLAAAVSSVLPAHSDGTSLRQLVGTFVRQNFKTLNLPDVASAQAAKKWAEAHAKEGSGLELDFVYALAQASDVSITVAVVTQAEQLRFYRACCKAPASDQSHVFGFADGTYCPVGWSSKVTEENVG